MKLLLLVATVASANFSIAEKKAFCSDVCQCNCGKDGILDKILQYVDCSLPNVLALTGVITKPQADQTSHVCTIASDQYVKNLKPKEYYNL